MDKELIQLQNLTEAYARQRWRNSLPQVLQGIRSVYGGFLGEKLSQDSPKDVWEALARIGVSQIIDLRYHYDSEKFRTRCKEYGISYYNYPIHNDAETIASMVENYSRFTELLCNGHFYMQGWHTSRVALCLYWALSKCPGLYPYDLRREIKHDERTMKRVVPILYGMNRYSEERYGKEPYMPADYYEIQRERIKDFIENDGPKKASYSVFHFTRAYRNETVVYDISIEGRKGVVGYLYAPRHSYVPWEYDIVMRPGSVSGEADSFEEAQIETARTLCEALTYSVNSAALPESVKLCVSLLRQLLYR